MNNHLLAELAVITRLRPSAKDSKLFTVKFKNRKSFEFIPGQFMMVGLPGFGEAPFDICGDPGKTDYFELSVRSVGDLTRKLNALKKGDQITVRGPYGNGLPHMEKLTNKNIVFVGGGCGFVTARSFVYKFIGDQLYKDRSMQLYCGVRSWDQILFQDEFASWKKKGIEINLAIEDYKKNQNKNLCKVFSCVPGRLTDLLDKIVPEKQSTAILCGPPVMYKFVIKKLKKLKFRNEDIYLSLERRMHCGLGICQHCAIGPYYVCKDGPVFRYDRIKRIPGVL